MYIIKPLLIHLIYNHGHYIVPDDDHPKLLGHDFPIGWRAIDPCVKLHQESLHMAKGNLTTLKKQFTMEQYE
jgi:hypothetical protein